eukprot:m.286733 g.286733  ORF g.286733 m.286733 type:complete len:1330 (+) comp11636_c0_seq1:36-4025(+)
MAHNSELNLACAPGTAPLSVSEYTALRARLTADRALQRIDLANQQLPDVVTAMVLRAAADLPLLHTLNLSGNECGTAALAALASLPLAAVRQRPLFVFGISPARLPPALRAGLERASIVCEAVADPARLSEPDVAASAGVGESEDGEPGLSRPSRSSTPAARLLAGSAASDTPSSPAHAPVATPEVAEAIFAACKDGHLGLLATLVTSTNVNLRDLSGRKSTPLHFAAGYGRQPVIELLLERGADVDAGDQGGLIPLHNACSYGHVSVVQLLLDAGSQVNARDDWGFTPLHEAASKGKREVCVLLLQHGADWNIKNIEGRTPADVAASSIGNIFRPGNNHKTILDACKAGDLQTLTAHVTPININCSASDGRESTPLHLAAGFNRVAIIKFLLGQGAQVGVRDKGGLVPLHNACSYGHLEIARLLLEKGAEVNVADLWRFTPLHEAASKGRIEVCALLLQFGADPELRNIDNQTCFDVAKNKETHTMLVQHVRGGKLLAAIRDQDLAAVRDLLAADPELLLSFASTNTHTTPLHIAAESTTPEAEGIFDLLVSAAPSTVLNAKDAAGRTCLHVAALNSNLNGVKKLIAAGININLQDGQGATALLLSAEHKKHDIMRCLLRHGADPSVPNASGARAEDVASAAGRALLHGEVPDVELQVLEAAKTGNLAALNRLLDANNELVNCRDPEGRNSTALHFAAGFNRLAAAKLLISRGADVHCEDKGGLVPLHNACSYGHFEICKLLVESGASVNTADMWNFTPLHEAAHKGKLDIAKLLIEHGADLNKRNCDGKRPMDLVGDDQDLIDLLSGDAALLEAAKLGQLDRVRKLVRPDNVNCRDAQGRNSTPLHFAAGYNQLAVVQCLIDAGADVNAQDRGGLIPLHNAASYGHNEVAEVLIDNGSEVNAKDKWSFSPLHEAASKGRTQMCTLLLQHGADANSRNEDGKTPLQLATAEDVIVLLNAVSAQTRIATAPTAAAPRQSQLSAATASSLQGASTQKTKQADPHLGFRSKTSDGAAESERAMLIGEDEDDVQHLPPPAEEVPVQEDPDGSILLKGFLEKLSLQSLYPLLSAVPWTQLCTMGHIELEELGILDADHRSALVSSFWRDCAPRTLDAIVAPPQDWTDEELVSVPPDTPTYAGIEKRILSTIQQHEGAAGGNYSTFKITSMQRIQNRGLWQQYAFRRQLVAMENDGDPGERLLFHGSPFAETIALRGFDERHAFFGGMFGAGIYFAQDSSKSNQYVHGIGGGTGCKQHQNTSCYECERIMLVCRVTLGHACYQASSNKVAHAPPGHHSVVGKPTPGGLAFYEYVVYRGEQAYPAFRVTYKLVPP